MTAGRNKTNSPSSGERTGARAILRVPEVLMAIAGHKNGTSLADLSRELDVPKTSLFRLLRTLEQGGYLISNSGLFLPGPECFRLAALLHEATPPAFAAAGRPVLEWLAKVTGETAMLARMTEQEREIVYTEVVESSAPLRFGPMPGDRRPLYAVPAGKVILAFQQASFQQTYLETTDVVQTTPEAATKEDLPATLDQIHTDWISFDRNGYIYGGSALASPVFSRDGSVRHAVSLSGPTERIVDSLRAVSDAVLEAGERISRALGYTGPYANLP